MMLSKDPWPPEDPRPDRIPPYRRPDMADILGLRKKGGDGP